MVLTHTFANLQARQAGADKLTVCPTKVMPVVQLVNVDLVA